jgi:hypothetical protein
MRLFGMSGIKGEKGRPVEMGCACACPLGVLCVGVGTTRQRNLLGLSALLLAQHAIRNWQLPPNRATSNKKQQQPTMRSGW